MQRVKFHFLNDANVRLMVSVGDRPGAEAEAIALAAEHLPGSMMYRPATSFIDSEDIYS